VPFRPEHISSRDNFIATLKYAEGSVCTLIYTALGSSEFPKENIQIYYDSKTLVIDDFKDLRVYGSKSKGWKGLQDKGHLQELLEFGCNIRDGKGSTIPLDEMIRATELSFLVDSEVKK